MSSPITHEIYALAALSLGWSPTDRIEPSDIPRIVGHHKLDVKWLDHYLVVQQRGGPGHVERIEGPRAVVLFRAVVFCSALIGGAA
jgi:hypothetical protein